MATTTITATTLAETLEDYHIRLTGVDDAPPVQVTARQSQAQNPPHWPQNYRRVPPYRPINRHLDPAERPNGASTGEYIFVNVMLNGVRINSFLVTTYEKSFGKIYPRLTRYDIGGEW
ncbi:hypothetical protein BJX66DRAFT_345712 [Aspergillus keveii]|uniref:Uncharacterized protein n=1 Tax=Aspergillus keveii TaxID=714993 RepID=A0ABR4FH67_9EURO